MTKIKEVAKGTDTVVEKLKTLYFLQLIDSKLDRIRVLKGELPMEVKDLEDDIEGMKKRVEKMQVDMKEFEEEITTRKTAKKDAENFLKKYEKDQSKVKNNREYESINKEIELQKLEIQLSDKKVREATNEIKLRGDQIAQLDEDVKTREKVLKKKKSELDEIVAETQKEEDTLAKKSKEAAKGIEERMLLAYHKIRRSYRNGVAVALIARDSCGGCFNSIPPQRQLEIKQYKKVVQCEYCGRILIDNELAQSVEVEA